MGAVQWFYDSYCNDVVVFGLLAGENYKTKKCYCFVILRVMIKW